MIQENKDMAGGHCFGFSVLGLRFFQNLVSTGDFGAAAVPGLALEGNEKLQREIAYSFEFQVFQKVGRGPSPAHPTRCSTS